MDWQPEQPDPEPDPLERLLAEAQWAEPSGEAIGRLRRQWQSLGARQSRRRRWAWAAAAAAILVAAGLTFSMTIGRVAIGPQPANLAVGPLPSLSGRGAGGEGRDGEDSQESPSIYANHPHPNPLRAPAVGWSGEGTSASDSLSKGEGTVASKPLPKAEGAVSSGTRPGGAKLSGRNAPANRHYQVGSPPAGTFSPAVTQSVRPPNPYELATLVAYRRTRADRQRRAASGPTEAVDDRRDTIDLAVDQLVAEPNARVREVAQPLLADRGESEAALAARIGRMDGPRQVAAVRLLAEIATSQSLPLLQRLAARPGVHAEVMRCVARLSDSPTLGRLSRDERDPALRQELLATLLRAATRDRFACSWSASKILARRPPRSVACRSSPIRRWRRCSSASAARMPSSGWRPRRSSGGWTGRRFLAS